MHATLNYTIDTFAGLRGSDLIQLEIGVVSHISTNIATMQI